jgi:hypothetical protein
VSVYDQNGLRSIHNHEFMTDQEFLRAYNRGIKAVGCDYQWHWRVHVGLWAVASAAKLVGDFVACGVNRGFMNSAIMTLMDWDSTGRTFYLLDTFAGLDERYISPGEKASAIMERNAQEIASGSYTLDINLVRDNFSEWKNVKIIVGSIPETLHAITSEQIAFLHLGPQLLTARGCCNGDALGSLGPGAFVVLDDYAYSGYRSQKLGIDAFARARGVAVLSLPTGQGLIIKPVSDFPTRAAPESQANWAKRLKRLLPVRA